MITEEHVREMKLRLKIFHDGEDEHIKNLLIQSYYDLSERCSFTGMSDVRAQELVFERTRYAYHDSLEYFNENFLSMITSLALTNLDVIEDETI